MPILENVKAIAASYLYKTASTRRSVYRHRLRASKSLNISTLKKF